MICVDILTVKCETISINNNNIPLLKIIINIIFVMITKVMYDDKAVSSARWHGLKGLGTELVRLYRCC